MSPWTDMSACAAFFHVHPPPAACSTVALPPEGVTRFTTRSYHCQPVFRERSLSMKSVIHALSADGVSGAAVLAMK